MTILQLHIGIDEGGFDPVAEPLFLIFGHFRAQVGDECVVAGQHAVVSGDSLGLALLHVIHLNLIVVVFAYPDRRAIEAQPCGMVFLV